MKDAYSFLVRFSRLKQNRIEAWSPEEAIAAAEVAGFVFQDQRNWGAIFKQLAKDGYIVRSGLFPRATSNGSWRPGWIGK